MAKQISLFITLQLHDIGTLACIYMVTNRCAEITENKSLNLAQVNAQSKTHSLLHIAKTYITYLNI